MVSLKRMFLAGLAVDSDVPVNININTPVYRLLSCRLHHKLEHSLMNNSAEMLTNMHWLEQHDHIN